MNVTTTHMNDGSVEAANNIFPNIVHAPVPSDSPHDDGEVGSSSPKKTFRAYTKTTLDTPLFHFILEPILPLLRPIMVCLYAIRWELSRPLQTRILPRWVPLINTPGLRFLSFLTIGQVVLAMPIVILMLAGYYLTFTSPNVDQSGVVASYALYLCFITANKTNSIFSFLFGISFERMIPYHNLSALTAVILSLFHGYVAFINADGVSSSGEGGASSDSGDRRLSSDESQYGLNGPNPNLQKFAFDGDTNTTGSLLALSMTALVALSIFPVLRRKFFDLWLWTHILLAICTIIFCLMHEVTLIVLVAIWWLVDLSLRYLVMAGCRYPTKARLTKILPDVVQVSFPKPQGFDYNPGQFVQVAVPDLGALAFHPISISSAPHESTVTLHVRALGDWSKRLVELAEKKDEVRMFLEGPYGCLSVDTDDHKRYQMALCVSGGIGVTHCQSVAKSLLYDHINGRNLKQLRFIWTIRDLNMLQILPPLEQQVLSSEPTDIELAEISLVTEGSESSGSSTNMRTMPSINKTSMAGLVETDIFVTKGSNTESQVEADHGHNRTIHYGRPNLDVILDEMKENAKKQGVTHVAVFVCGPKSLVDKLQDTCRRHSQTVTELGTGVTFDVHEEIFDF